MLKRNVLIFIVFAVLTLVYVSCNGGSGKSDNTPETANLWKQNCSVCHGVDGQLGVNGAKDLRLSELDVPSRIAIITNGKGKMVGFGNSLSADQISSLAKYTLTFK